MEKLNLIIEDELSILEKYHLTVEEWFFTKLLFLASAEENNPLPLMKYVQLYSPDLRELLQSLQNKGIILKSYKIPNKGEQFDPENVEFNSIFLKNYMKFSLEMGQELFNNYPVTMVINGITTSVRGCGDKYKDLDDMLLAYGKAIGNNPKRHEEVLELLNWAKDNNVLYKGLSKFIADREWQNLKAMQDDPSINYNSIRCL